MRGEYKKYIGILHPQINDFAGGEKVMWYLVAILLKQDPNIDIRIFCNPCNPIEVQKKVRSHFHLNLKFDRLEFRVLRLGHLMNAETFFTARLLMQYIGSWFVAFEICLLHGCAKIVETSGSHFATPVFAAFGIPSLIYVHYPLLNIEYTKNRGVYHAAMHALYRLSGFSATKVIANSTWTCEKLKSMWTFRKIKVIYPPCRVGLIPEVREDDDNKVVRIASLGQFRQEKRQELQISIVQKLAETNSHLRFELNLIGSIRGERDLQLLNHLRTLSESSPSNLECRFHVNLPFKEVQFVLLSCQYGLHTMREEHFGISIVDMMSHGLIVFSHDSGGPSTDIIKNKFNGFLCKDDEFVDKMKNAIGLSKKEKNKILFHQQITIEAFSEQAFTRECFRTLHEF